MPAGKFEEQLTMTDGVILAAGPLDKTVAHVIELCVWVSQRQEDPKKSDAVANAMSPERELAELKAGGMSMSEAVVEVTKVGTDDARWTLLLRDQETDTPFTEGSATAAAIAVFETAPPGSKRTAFVWSEPVWLKVAQATT
jgi:hypothetical protein